MERPVTHVQLVDDSVVVRGMLRELIGRNPKYTVAAASINGVQAVADYRRLKPDIVLMDIEMPEKDGLTALKEILAFDPKAKVIMCSSLTQSGAQAAVEAMRLGAVDCLAKPSAGAVERSLTFDDELYAKLDQFSAAAPAPHGDASDAPAPARVPTVRGQGGDTLSLLPYPSALPHNFPQALAIGSSTGGPQALMQLLAGLHKKPSLPVFITQHIPQGFSKPLAENIQKHTGFITHEAAQGMIVEAGHVYLAPGGYHMGIRPGAPKTIELLDTPPVNYCKPSVDVMLDSLSGHCGAGILTVILTGMGSDGRDAVQRLVRLNPHNIVIAQDRHSSVVWGMPGAVAQAGLCHAVLPLDKIAAAVNRLIGGHIPAKVP